MHSGLDIAQKLIQQGTRANNNDDNDDDNDDSITVFIPTMFIT